jgi:hypothetical protein
MLAATQAGAAVASGGTAPAGRRSHTGTIGGAPFRVAVKTLLAAGQDTELVHARDPGSAYELVFDLGTFTDAPMTPAFARFTPPAPLRPSR